MVSGTTVAEFVAANEQVGDEIKVTLSNELVQLLSEQMYQTPIKAIEELIVNSYDANAQSCRASIPLAPENATEVVVFDDGDGMGREGLTDLWHIGRSRKRLAEKAEAARDQSAARAGGQVDGVRLKRKQIGKFGIGKLATYAIANIVTYISKTAEGVLAVTMDYSQFRSDPTGGSPIMLAVRSLPTPFAPGHELEPMLLAVGTTTEEVNSLDTWTCVVLEELKPKLGSIKKRTLSWVLSTAMPLTDTFSLWVNGETVESSKAAYEHIVHFNPGDLPKGRLEAIEAETGEAFRVQGSALVSSTFPAGISGEVYVTDRTLYGGKSVDLARSHGYFVKVRERLVEESDPLFGIEPLSYEVFNRFRADLVADDLDAVVTAPREGFETSELVLVFKKVLVEIFYEARSRYQAEKRNRADAEKRKSEDVRQYVGPTLVDRPLADALIVEAAATDEPADWFYLAVEDPARVDDIIGALYTDAQKRYRYADSDLGATGRMVRFVPDELTFYMNSQHPVVLAYSDPGSQQLLEDLVTAEVLLEVYMRESGVSASATSQVLERRDALLRGLAADHRYSSSSIAAALRESLDDERELEVNLVLGARALGFVARHLSGSGRADGIAEYSRYPGGVVRIALEAKSSEEVPSLGAIDFAGLETHTQNLSQDPGETRGCLLIAPAYPGSTKGDDAEAALRAVNTKVSCWTVEQFARVVENAEVRHLAAEDVVEIVTTAFTPDQVVAKIEELLAEPRWDDQALYAAVVDALRSLEGRLSDRPRSFDQVAGEITHRDEFREVPGGEIRRAILDVAGASQGLLIVVGGNQLSVRGSYDELERRVAQLIGRAGDGRRQSNFRA